MNEEQIDWPVRKRLLHEPPIAVTQYAVGADYFITICADRNYYTENGGVNNPLIVSNNALRLILALDRYFLKKVIFPKIALVMPDHIHLIATFDESVNITKMIRDYKRWTARDIGIVWQDGFFDHRLRGGSELFEKINYIKQNPVRKNLVENAESWPYVMEWKR